MRTVLDMGLNVGLAVNSDVTSAALNMATGSNVTAIDSSSGGAVMVNFSRMTADVDDNTVVLSGMLAAPCMPVLLAKVLMPKLPHAHSCQDGCCALQLCSALACCSQGFECQSVRVLAQPRVCAQA